MALHPWCFYISLEIQHSWIMHVSNKLQFKSPRFFHNITKVCTIRSKLGGVSSMSKYNIFDKKAPTTMFIVGDRECCPICFEYKTLSEGSLVAGISRIQFHQFWKEWKFFIFRIDPNISSFYIRGGIVFKMNGREFSITSYKIYHCRLFTSRDIKTTIQNFWL